MSETQILNERNRNVDAILDERLTSFRMEMAALVRDPESSFPPEAFEDFVRRLAQALPDASYLLTEAQNVKSAITTLKTSYSWNEGAANNPPNLERPETQLLWAATLLYFDRNMREEYESGYVDKMNLSTSEIWKQLAESPRARAEIAKHTYYITEALRYPGTNLQWTTPGKGFSFDPVDKNIKADLQMSLIAGLEHVRGVLFREIGHNRLTTKFPRRQREIYQKILPLRARERNKTLTKAEYKELRMLSVEWELRNMLTSAAESNCINRYAANMSQQLAQDYGYSLNHCLTTIGGYGDYVQTTKQTPERLENSVQTRFLNVVRAVDMAFFRSNGYFSDTEEGWNKVGVKPGWVEKKIATNDNNNGNGSASFPSPDFAYLMTLCSGPKGLEHLQPGMSDRLYGTAYLHKKIDDYTEQRNRVTDRIWDLYLDDLAKELMKTAEIDIDKEIEDMDDSPQQDQDGEPDESQSGEGQSGEGQSGEGQPGEGEPGEGEPGEGEPGEGEPGEGEPGESRPDKDWDPSKGGLDEGGKEVNVEKDDGSTGKMPDVDMPEEDPKNGMNPEDEQDADADGQNQSLDELMEELKKIQEEAENAQAENAEDADTQSADAEGEGEDGQDADGQGADGEGESNSDSDASSESAGEGGENNPLLDEIAQGDWGNYAARVAELAGPIAMVARILEKIKAQQLEWESRRSRSLDMLPENNEIDRLDRAAHKNLVIKQKTGQELKKKDFNRFRINKNYQKPTDIDIVLMIDGSGSMDTGKFLGNRRATPLEISILTSIVLYEAAKKINANVYITMWGTEEPVIIAKPGDDAQEISKNFMKARRGLNSGTDMEPVIRKVTKMIAEQKVKKGAYSGYSHWIVLSDGAIYDKVDVTKAIDILFESTRQVTLDFAIIKKGNEYEQKSEMELLGEKVKQSRPTQKIGIVAEEDRNLLPVAVVAGLLEKLQGCRSFIAVPNEKKKSELRRAHRRMEMR